MESCCFAHKKHYVFEMLIVSTVVVALASYY